MTTSNYSLYNSYTAEFGLGKYFANKAAKDIQTVMGSGATQKVIDDVVKRLLKSGEKAGKQRAKVYGRYARKVWNTSPKLRRNVKIAGVAGAGLVGLNALTGLKTVYDIGKGIKNKVMPKKQQNAQYSLFSPHAVEFARNQQLQEQPKENKNWGDTIRGYRRNAGLVGSGVGVIGGLASGGSIKARLAKGVIGGIAGNIVASPVGDTVGRLRASTKNLKNYDNKNDRNVARQGRRGLLAGGLLGAGLYAANAKNPKIGKMLRTTLATGAVGSMVGATGGRIYNRTQKKKEAE